MYKILRREVYYFLHSGHYITDHVTDSACIGHAKIRDVYEFQYAGATELEHL